MNSESSTNSESFDDDINQCREDILRARRRANSPEETDTASDSSNSQVRIPKFEDLVPEQSKPVEAQWETPSSETAGSTENAENKTGPVESTESTHEQVEPISEPAEPEESTETEFDGPIEMEMQESSAPPAKENLQEEPAQQDENIKQVELNLDNIVTAAEEMALFSKEEEEEEEEKPKLNTDQQKEQSDDNNEGMDTLRQAVASQKKKSSIPSFDLAHKILTEQRKVAAKRRQRPEAKRDLSSITPPVDGIMGRVIEENKNQPETAKEQDNTPENMQVHADTPDTPIAEQTSQPGETPPASSEKEHQPKFKDIPQIELESAEPVELENIANDIAEIAEEHKNEHKDKEAVSQDKEENIEDTAIDQEQKPAEEIEYTETPQVADEKITESEEAPEFANQPGQENTPEIVNESYYEDIPETLDEEQITEVVPDFSEEAPEEAADDFSIEDDFSVDMDDELDQSLETIIESADESQAALEEFSEQFYPAPPKMSAAACGIIKNAGHLNSRQKLIIANIVKKDIENFCKAS